MTPPPTAVAPAPTGPLREIRGPSAYGGGARRFLNLTWMIAVTEFRLSYFGSALGYLWSLMRPLLFFGVLYLVFSQVLRFGGGIKAYPVLLLFNIVLFSFFSEATQASVTSVVNREGLVRKMHFPRMVIPLSTVLTGILNLALNLVAVVVFMLLYGLPVRWTWLLLPLIVVPLIMFTAGVAMLLSSLYVRFRDIAPIWSVVVQLLFYATPVLYVATTIQHLGNRLVQQILLSNPLAALLEQARRWVIDPSAPGAITSTGGWELFLIPVAVFVAVCGLGLWVFNREAPRIAELL
ncbi:MAG: ABC transporter permease [Actinomycetota bacterium]|nr:ABC transporter permease [Actinomycetota bacterium]